MRKKHRAPTLRLEKNLFYKIIFRFITFIQFIIIPVIDDIIISARHILFKRRQIAARLQTRLTAQEMTPVTPIHILNKRNIITILIKNKLRQGKITMRRDTRLLRKLHRAQNQIMHLGIPNLLHRRKTVQNIIKLILRDTEHIPRILHPSAPRIHKIRAHSQRPLRMPANNQYRRLAALLPSRDIIAHLHRQIPHPLADILLLRKTSGLNLLLTTFSHKKINFPKYKTNIRNRPQ